MGHPQKYDVGALGRFGGSDVDELEIGVAREGAVHVGQGLAHMILRRHAQHFDVIAHQQVPQQL